MWSAIRRSWDSQRCLSSSKCIHRRSNALSSSSEGKTEVAGLSFSKRWWRFDLECSRLKLNSRFNSHVWEWNQRWTRKASWAEIGHGESITDTLDSDFLWLNHRRCTIRWTRDGEGTVPRSKPSRLCAQVVARTWELQKMKLLRSKRRLKGLRWEEKFW